METQLHPAISRVITENLELLLDDTREGLGFQQFDAETSPQVYLGLSILYFFHLGNKLHLGKLPYSFDGDLLKHLDANGLINPKPKTYQELKQTFETLFLETSKYLTKIKV